MTAENFVWRMQCERFELFKAQNPEDCHFDVTFEVDGNKIYANKYLLQTISKPFNAMFSERWRSKDDVIKLDTYNYDDFFQFLTFIYSGSCKLTNANISRMIDMAEFYDIAVFKDFCDIHISKIEYTTDDIFVFMLLATKYSLSKSTEAIEKFIQKNLLVILGTDQFMNLKKSAVELFVTFKRDPRQEEQLFEAVYKWAENQFITVEAAPAKRKYVNWTEEMKGVLSGILPNIKFNKMNPHFICKYVVPKGFLFTYEELAAILHEHQKITVTVKRYGKSLSGSFVETCNVFDSIKAVVSNHPNHRGPQNWTCSDKPSKPSDLKKNETVELYLVLADRKLQVKKSADVNEEDYLLCEMKGDTDIIIDRECQIDASRNCFDS